MSDANSLAIHFIRAGASYGSVPSSGNPKTLRFTGESFKRNTETVKSAEIVSTRDVKDIIRVNASIGGGFNFEMSYGSFDDQLSDMLMDDNDWSTQTDHTPNSDGTDYSFNTSGTITDTSGVTSFSDADFPVGSWITVSGAATTAGILRRYKITAKSTTSIANDTLTVQPVPVATEAGLAGTTITHEAQIVNGTTLRDSVYQKVFTDLSIDDTRMVGLAIDGGELAIDAQGILTGSFSMLGKIDSQESNALATDTSGTLAAATTTSIMNAVDNVPTVLEAGAAYTITGATATYANALRAQPVVGVLGSNSLGKGRFVAEGTHNAYFATQALFTKYQAFTQSSLSWEEVDVDGNVYIFDFPAIKYTDGEQIGGGIDTDIFAAMTWEAFRHPTEGVTARVVRIPAA